MKTLKVDQAYPLDLAYQRNSPRIKKDLLLRDDF